MLNSILCRALIFHSARLSCRGFNLVDPFLVDIHWGEVNAEVWIIQDRGHQGLEQILKGSLTPSCPVEVNHHLQYQGVSSEDVCWVLHLKLDLFLQGRLEQH
uniref:Putative secreted protein n=1 Tax=Ixodes ricinus TaxID=34613 RepID=A0A6B0UF54_IXORI